MRDLTRQYRPDNLDSIIGQEVLTKTLKAEIKNNSVGHAYLFCGPRGTGKTTTARAFAKALDAQVIELDAASNNGVENIRNLKDDVLYLPTDNRKYKVYIIDESHMMTTAAFNAFLKTLEEPPTHVIFILATTDPQKLPITILSRCQRFDLKRITVHDIVCRLAYICEAESIKLDGNYAQEVLEYIAKSVDGGLRDAIKLLQKCTSLDDVITVQTVIEALGSVNIEHIKNIIEHITNKDVKNTIIYFNKLVMDGVDIKTFLADIVDYLTDDMKNDIINENYNINTRIKLTDIILDLLSSLRNATQIKTLVELAFIKMCVKTSQETNTIQQENEVQTVAQQKKEIKEAIESLPVDETALKQIADKLTNLEKRMVINEMTLDQFKYQRR